MFTSCTAYGPEDLDQEFKLKFKDILEQSRGGGYWIWKPYIIQKKLQELNEGDFLVYLDAGCTINNQGKQRFNEYLDMLNKSDLGIISFQMNHPEREYTTKQIFDYFNLDINSDIAKSGQYMATLLIIKKNKHSLDLFDKLFKVINKDKYLITDKYNKENQDIIFKDNRHDQSIFSIIRKLNKSIVIQGDETWFDFNGEEAKKYPFWGTRRRD